MAITQINKRTFWNTLRFERNIRYKDLIQLFPDKSIGSISTWFTGQRMPDTDTIKTLCDFFDVDFSVGKTEFEKASSAWRSDGHTGKRESLGEAEPREYAPRKRKSKDEDSQVTIDELPSEVEEEPVIETQVAETKSTIPPQQIFSLIYGKVSYEVFYEFTANVAKRNPNALKDIYGQVSYEDYEAIREVILDWCKGA